MFPSDKTQKILDPTELRIDKRTSMIMGVNYRSTGSFLLSYSLNLSTGGLFLETNEALAPGQEILLRLAFPNNSDPVEINSKVIWRRAKETSEGPIGVGVQFEPLNEKLNQEIESVIKDFKGMKLMAIATDHSSMQRLTNYLQTLLNCQVLCQEPRKIRQDNHIKRVDLILIDLDSSGPDGLRALTIASEMKPLIPTIALSRSSLAKERAKEHQATATLDNPPDLTQLRHLVFSTLSQPVSLV